MPVLRGAALWAAVVLAIAVPIGAAMMSPLLQWRQPIYIMAGFAGAFALALLLVQPLLITGVLPGLSPYQQRQVHRRTGGLLVAAVVIHVGGLWWSSPPDIEDALLFVSPTPFATWGVIAMWAVFATALLAAFRRRLRLSPRSWRLAHASLAVVIAIGTVVHSVLIEGTVEPLSKAALCALVIAATVKVVAGVWVRGRRGVGR